MIAVKRTKLANIDIARLQDWSYFSLKTHLGRILNPGDYVMGYDLTSANVSPELEEIIRS